MSLYNSIITDNDDLLPVEGKDEAYDEIAEEIRGLEEELDKMLKKLERQAGYVVSSLFTHLFLTTTWQSQILLTVLA